MPAAAAAAFCSALAAYAGESKGPRGWIALGPGKFARALEPLVSHRKSQGLDARFVPIEEACPGGEASPEAIRGFVRKAWKESGGALAYLLLAADAGPVGDEVPAGPYLPPALLEPKFKSTAIPCPDIIASDAFFGMMDDDEVPDVAVGRLPADTGEEAAAMAKKIVDYEKSADFGSWRKRIDLIAGTGGFGQAADSMIEAMFRKLLSDLLDPAFDVRLTYANPASPYCWPPPDFSAKVVELLNEGSLVAAYVGHGSPRAFDTLRWQGKLYTIFDSEAARSVAIGKGPPVMVIIACSTGHFDHPAADCISEELVKRPGGPVAVFSSTRISHPYANGLVAKELISNLFGGKHRAIGDAVDAVRKSLAAHKADDLDRMIDGFAGMFMKPDDFEPNRADHVHLYALFGDPATPLALPEARIEVEAPAKAGPGSKLTVRCRIGSGVSGKATLTLETWRGAVNPSGGKPSGAGAAEAMKKNWLEANDTVLSSVHVDFEGGAFSAVLDVPQGSPAECRHLVKAFAECPGLSAAGWAEIEIAPPAGEEDFIPIPDGDRR